MDPPCPESRIYGKCGLLAHMKIMQYGVFQNCEAPEGKTISAYSCDLDFFGPAEGNQI